MIKIYNEKTGNPYVDNQRRKSNKALYTIANKDFKVSTPRGRRRKKYIKSQELPKLMNLIHLLTLELVEAYDEQEKRRKEKES